MIKRYPDKNLRHIDLKNSFWTQSLFRRIGYKKRVVITGKVNVPEAVRKEIEVAFLVSEFEKHKIPPSLDQTPAKVVPGSKSTQVLKGATDKRAITATLSTSLEGDFLLYN